MKNLSEVGVLEMTEQEVKSVDGGIIPLLVVAGTAAFWGLAFYGSFKAGYDAAQK